MDRRAFGRGAAALLLTAASRAARPQPVGRNFRIGYLGHTTPLREFVSSPSALEFAGGLRSFGWHEGINIRIVWRSAEGHFNRLPALARELVQMPVDVILTAGPGVDAAADATKTIPIVMSSHGSPVPRHADSLSHPGRNVTGLSQGVGAEYQKQLSLLKEAVPGIKRVALVAQAQGAAADRMTGVLQQPRFVEAAKALGLELTIVSFGDAGGIAATMRSAARQGTHALLFDDIGVLTYAENQRLVAEEAVRHRLPVMHYILDAVENGGLMAYGRDIRYGARRAAYYVDRILRGAKAGDLPIEQPGNIELHVNLKAARAIGIELPRSVLLQADRVIQ